MTIYWLAELPQAPMLNGLQYTPLGNVESFAVEDGEGADITGPRFAASGVDMTATFAMSKRQYDAFVAFWNTDLKGGAVTWQMRDPFDDLFYGWILRPGEKSYSVTMPNRESRFVTLPLRRLPA